MLVRREGKNKVSFALYEKDLNDFNESIETLRYCNNAKKEEIMKTIMVSLINYLAIYIRSEAYGQGIRQARLNEKAFMESNCIRILFTFDFETEVFVFPDGMNRQMTVTECMSEVLAYRKKHEVNVGENTKTENTEDDSDDSCEICVLEFKNIDDAIRYAKEAEAAFLETISSLYQKNNKYYLLYGWNDDMVSTEFNGRLIDNALNIGYIMEHGRMIIEDNAIEKLSKMSEKIYVGSCDEIEDSEDD